MPNLTRAALLRAIIQPPPAQTSPNPSGASKNRQAPSRVILPSGLRLVVAEHPGSPLATVLMRVRAGSALETDATAGAAHFIEHAVFKGGGARQPGAYDREMEAVGGEFFARTTRDFTEYTALLPAAGIATAARLMADLVRTPEFRAADVDRERRVIAREMNDADSDAARLGFRLLSTAAYPEGHGYHRPLMGTPEALSRLTPDDLRAFWKLWYRPDNITVVVVGGVNAAEVRKAVEPLFPPGEKGPDSVPAITAFVPLGRIARAESLSGSAQARRDVTTLALGFRVPPTDAADSLPLLDTLASCLTGGAGRLTRRLVDRDKVALSVGADYLPGVLEGLLLVTATARPGSLAALEEGVLAELRRMREDTLTDDETDAAKAAAEGRMRYALETVETHARLLASWDQYTPMTTEESYAARVTALGRRDLQVATLRELTPLSFAVAAVGPASTAAAEAQE